jgi:hypothetical protein
VESSVVKTAHRVCIAESCEKIVLCNRHNGPRENNPNKRKALISTYKYCVIRCLRYSPNNVIDATTKRLAFENIGLPVASYYHLVMEALLQKKIMLSSLVLPMSLASYKNVNEKATKPYNCIGKTRSKLMATRYKNFDSLRKMLSGAEKSQLTTCYEKRELPLQFMEQEIGVATKNTAAGSVVRPIYKIYRIIKVQRRTVVVVNNKEKYYSAWQDFSTYEQFVEHQIRLV